MTCSKLFSGDLPEVSASIVQNLRNDINTLYSLTLVNRFWCRLSTPLLWEDPFSVKYQGNLTFHFLDTYLLFLNDNDKNEVKEILNFNKFDLNSHKPLFNYPSLIKTLNLSRIRLHVINWFNSSCNTISTSPTSNSSSNNISASPTSFFQNWFNSSSNNISASSTSLMKHSSNKKRYFPLTLINHLKIELNEEHKIYATTERVKLISILLFKLFIENNASLSNLHICIDNSFPYQLFYYICDMILDNSKIFSNIEIFSFKYYRSSLSQFNLVQTFLHSLPSLFTSVRHIDISTNVTGFDKKLVKLIKSQSQLSSIKIRLLEFPLLNSLILSSNNLTSINFSSCYFSNIMEFNALSYLTQLESLQFKRCVRLNSKVIQPLLNIVTPLKIKTLVLVDNEFIDGSITIQLLIQKIGPYIENLVLSVSDDELRGKFFDTIIGFCQKIKFLHLNHIDFINVSQLSKMMFNFDNYLKYLTLEIKSTIYLYNDLKSSSIILKELSNFLPLSLYYLDLNLVIIPKNLQVFFENCKQVELKRLLIRNRNNDDVDTTLKVIKNFVKEKNLDFLTYGIGYILSTVEETRHKSLENLVEETQSFVKMMKYDDLVIKVSDIDGNLDY